MSIASIRAAIIRKRLNAFERHKIAKQGTCEIRLFYSLPRAFEIQVDKLVKEGFGDSILEDRHFSVPYAHLLAIERGEVIGVTRLFKRLIVFNRKTLTVGGFGSLTTKGKKRRVGVATALLKRGMRDFGMQNFDIAFLCTDINNPAMIRLYCRVGFVPLGKPYTYTGKSGLRYVEHNGMVAPVKSMDKLKYIVSGKEPLNIGAGSW